VAIFTWTTHPISLIESTNTFVRCNSPFFADGSEFYFVGLQADAGVA
jgi:hypothetical protein